MKVDGMCDISPTDRELKIKDKKLQENQGRRLFWGGGICGFLTLTLRGVLMRMEFL